MSEKYMKIKRVIIPTITMVIIASQLFGCASASKEDTYNMINESTEIELEYAVPDYDISEESTVELLPWLQLSSLETHPEIRADFDDYFKITGTTGNKEGAIYYNTDTQQADQNVTLYMVLKNASVKNVFVNVSSMELLGAMSAEHYADVEADDISAPYATINAYFELLPDQEDGQFDGDCTISRAQAMTLVMRATTPVNEAQAPEDNADFTTAVGESQYTNFAAPMNEYAYINTGNGLNEGVFNSAMSRGEYICMITNMLMSDYQESLEAKGYVDNYADKDVSITVVADAGDISYGEAISDATNGVPTDMYKTFETAVKYNLITEEALEDWDSSITKAEAVELFVSMVNNYTNDAGDFYYGGYQSPEELDRREAAQQEYNETAMFGKELPGEGTGMQKFQAWVKSQGADYALGWTFVYLNGRAAGDQPTYGVYMKPDSPLYGTVYHVGDTIPDGSRLDGTREEEDAIAIEEAKKNFEEEGGKIYTDPETGKTIWEIGD